MNGTRQIICFMLFAIFLVQFHISEARADIRCYALDSYSNNFIMVVQETLKAKGIDPGPVDGLWGSKTERGVAAFQRAVGLNVTYDLNGPTLRKLFGEGFDPKIYGLAPNPAMPAGIFKHNWR